MLDEDVCPKCESSNVQFKGSFDLHIDAVCEEYECLDCGCRYRATIWRTVSDIEIEGEDYE